MAQGEKKNDRPIERIQQNVLARSERRLLNWLCARLPAWVTPDRLTTFGMVGSLAIFLGYALSGEGRDWLWLAVAGYFVQWFGDSLDGSIARWRKIERPRFGYFIDHSCDGITTLLILAGLGLSPYLRLDIALLTLSGYLLLSIHAYLSVHVMGEMKLSYLSAGPTELRFVLLGLTAMMYVMGPTANWMAGLSLFDCLIGAVGALFIVLFVIQTMTVAQRLAAGGEQR